MTITIPKALAEAICDAPSPEVQSKAIKELYNHLLGNRPVNYLISFYHANGYGSAMVSYAYEPSFSDLRKLETDLANEHQVTNVHLMSINRVGDNK